MTSGQIFILFITFFVLQFCVTVVLILLNMHEVKKNISAVPDDFKSFITPETYRTSARYTLDKSKYTLVSETLHALLLFCLVVTGSFGRIDNYIYTLHLPFYGGGILFVGVIILFFYFLDLPLQIYSQFILENRYGFNKMTLVLFIKDQLKSIVISGILLAAVLLALFFFMDSAGYLWWIIAAGALIIFQLLLTVLYPLVIAPLFNTFTPLEEGELKTTLELLASENDFKTKGIFVVDGSKRSSHSNAYFTGFGRARRIVLFDTLISRLSPRQLASVLAHEIGHAKKHHLVRGFFLSSFLIFTVFFIINLLLPYLSLYQAFGFNRISYEGILVILAFCSGPFTFFLTPLFTMWSRRHEYEADAYAVKATGNKQNLKEGLIILAKENLSNLTPHPLYSFFHYSHPALAERLKAIEAVQLA